MRLSVVIALAVVVLGGFAAPAHADLGPCAFASPNVAYPPDEGFKEPWRNARVVDGSTIREAKALQALTTQPTIVRGLKLRGQSLAGLTLKDLCFDKADLTGTDWTGAKARRLAFVETDLSRAQLSGASLRESAFLKTDLTDAKAVGADFSGSQIESSLENGLDLRRANLTDVFIRCDLGPGFLSTCAEGAVDAREANLTRARLNEWRPPWRLDGARLDGTFVAFDQIETFRLANVAGQIVLVASGPHSQDAEARYSANEWRALLAAWPVPVEIKDGPSFDCRRARTAVEHHLCDRRNHMDWLDQRLARRYSEARAMGAVSVADQKRWLASRSRCQSKNFDKTDDCLTELYSDRANALIRAMGPPTWLKPGVTATYVDNDPGFSAAFKVGPLYQRLKPVIAESAFSVLVIKRLPGHRIEVVDASAAGARNFCGLYPYGDLTLNPKTRMFAARPNPEDLPPDDHGQRYDLVQLWRDHAEVFGEGVFTQCGSGAGWSSMTRLD